ncbi:MAG: 2-hydroxyacyl-CoA dehydratase family protein [Acetobacteraceae bacterium]|nr:2-hydroxyacyl-CoA dehydratase family protein [Acetobacteraceae bacterium]
MTAGAPRVGWLCTYVPEELIWAAGAVPVRLVPPAGQRSRASPLLPPNLCSYVRICLGLAEQGAFGRLDGVVITNCCNATQRLYDVWKAYRPQELVHYLDVPRRLDDSAVALYLDGLRRLAEDLSSLTGVRATAERLEQAAALYNRKRRLLAELDRARAEGGAPSPAPSELVREHSLRPVEEFLAAAGAAAGSPGGTGPSPSHRPPASPSAGRGGTSRRLRVMVSGGMAFHQDVIGLLEELGGLVVLEDHCLGRRYWQRQVEPGPDPLYCLARAYLEGPPCARMYGRGRLSALEREARRRGVEGVVQNGLQFCDTVLFEAPLLSDLARRLGVPFLALEADYQEGTALGQLRVRVQAFLESAAGLGAPDRAPRGAGSGREAADAGQGTGAGPEPGRSPFCQRLGYVRSIQQHLPLEAIRRLVGFQIDTFCRRIWADRRRYVWTSMVMPPEIFHALGLMPINSELVAGWHASLGLSRDLLIRAEAEGFSVGLCSYHKTALGAVLAGYLPPPRACAVSSNICDGAMKVSEFLEQRFGAGYFLLDLPHRATPRAIDYVAGQFEALVDFLVRETGAEFSPDRLREACRLSNRAREHWIAAHRLRQRAVLMPGNLGMRNLFGTTFLFGSPKAVEVAAELEDELRQRLEQGVRPLGPERCRLLWIHFAPLYRNQLMDYLEQGLGAAIAVDITNHCWWEPLDEDDPYASLARKALSHYYLGGPENRAAVYRGLARDFRVHGAVHFVHAGCRAIPGALQTVRDALEGMGVPMLELSGDCIDSRAYSEEQTRTRLEAFVEMLRGPGAPGEVTV